MSEYNWCHNPKCHTISTQSRVRGTGNNKVLRTVKINVSGNYPQGIWKYFCNNNCLFQFLNIFATEIANTYSVKQPSETPVKVIKEKDESSKYVWVNGSYERQPCIATRTNIERADE